ncbi:MAG: esterase-like activity of phytase family protein [Myxococcota bacterium]
MTIRDWRSSAVVSLPLVLLACAGPVDEGAAESVDSAAFALAPDATVAAVDVIDVQVPKRFYVPYTGGAQVEFPDGLPLSLGSGLRLRGERGCGCDDNGADGVYTLVGLSDRGPNGDAPDYLDTAGTKHPSKSYLVPSFTPKMVTIEVRRSGARVTHTQALSFGREAAVGLPPAALTTEIGVTESLTAYASSLNGIDPEGIDFDARGNAWISEEYGPSLLNVRARSGHITRRLVPGSGLPAILASRQVNRGFEGVAVTPSGKVYGLVQSTLDIAGKTKGLAQFIRLVEYDPRSGATRMFAYPHDVAAYKKSGDAKLGDLFALDDTRFLTIEGGKGKDGLRNVVYEFDIANATDLTGVTLASGSNAGKELEYGTAAEIAAQITMAKKTLVADLRAYGYTAEKSEGMTLIDDRTLVVINDNDFGATAVIENDANSSDPTDYVVDSNGVLTFEDAPSTGTYAIHAQTADAQRTQLFVFHLQQPFAGGCGK